MNRALAILLFLAPLVLPMAGCERPVLVTTAPPAPPATATPRVGLVAAAGETASARFVARLRVGAPRAIHGRQP